MITKILFVCPPMFLFSTLYNNYKFCRKRGHEKCKKLQQCNRAELPNLQLKTEQLTNWIVNCFVLVVNCVLLLLCCSSC